MGRLYSDLKLLRQTGRLEALLEDRAFAPAHVRIKPINRCNHDCWYCAYRADTLSLGGEMDQSDRLPTDKLFEIADDIVGMGVKAVTFSGGGEPLLYKELPEVVERLRRGGVRVATLTNGSNLRGRMADAFAEHGTWVRISLDAWDDASYAEARGVANGAFSRLMDNIADFVARDTDCVLGVSLIVGEANHGHVADVCATLASLGVDHVKISGAVISNDRAENNAYHRRFAHAVTAQIVQAREMVAGVKGGRGGRGTTIVDHYHETNETFERGYRSCPFARFLTVIGADGGVYLCQDKAYTTQGRLGSLDGRRFRDFWFDPETQERLRGFDPSESCRHHCVAHGKNIALHEILATDPEHALFV